MKQLILTITIIVCLTLIVAPTIIFAQDTTPIGNIKSGLNKSAGQAGINTAQNTDLSTRLGQAINFTFGLIGTIFLVVTLAGGVGWMTAGGNQEKVSRGKKFITSGVGGMLIIFMAYALVYVIVQALQLGAAGAS